VRPASDRLLRTRVFAPNSRLARITPGPATLARYNCRWLSKVSVIEACMASLHSEILASADALVAGVP
jgi:hypothetical protein